MEQAGLHTELENRLKVLATRIDEFSQMKGQAKGSKRLEDKNEIEKLERRFKALGDKLHSLDREGPDFRQGMEAEIEAGADELTRWIEEHLAWIDSGYWAGRPKRLHKT